MVYNLNLMKDLSLPEKIRVHIVKGKSGVYIAELPEYDIHTEAECESALDFMINDLIYAYFNVPKVLWGRIIYRKLLQKPNPQMDIQSFMIRQFIDSSLTPKFNE